MKFKLLAVISLCLIIQGCLATKKSVPTKEEVTTLVEQIIDVNDKDLIIQDFRIQGFDVREEDDGTLWITKEFPANFPTSTVYDIRLYPKGNKYIIERIKSFGKGL